MAFLRIRLIPPWLAGAIAVGVTLGDLWVGYEPGPDPALDRVIQRASETGRQVTWKLVRYPDTFPPAHVALQTRVAADWYELFPRLSETEGREEIWYLAEDRPPEDPLPHARSASLLRWDGHTGEVEHDGSCDLVIRRTHHYPGWLASVDHGPEPQVTKADGGLQAVHLPGSGVTHVSVRYKPKTLISSAIAALSATTLALALIAFDFALRRRYRSSSGPDRIGVRAGDQPTPAQPTRGEP